jgi:hypothetical protein
MDLADELQRIYESEINAKISWFWDGGVTVRLGEKMNGFLAEDTVNSVADILPLAVGGHRLHLSRFKLRAIARAGGEGAGGGSCLSTSAHRSRGALPALQVAERQRGII